MATINKTLQEFFKIAAQTLRVPPATTSDWEQRARNQELVLVVCRDRMSNVASILYVMGEQPKDQSDRLIAKWIDQLRETLAEPLPYEPWIPKGVETGG